MADGYTKIRNILITSSKLDEIEFRILVYLISISNSGICYPSISTIASQINSSSSTIKRKLNELVKKGFVLKENRILGTGKKTSNVYLINEDAISKNLKKEVQSETEEFKITEEEQEISDYDWLNL